MPDRFQYEVSADPHRALRLHRVWSKLTLEDVVARRKHVDEDLLHLGGSDGVAEVVKARQIGSSDPGVNVPERTGRC